MTLDAKCGGLDVAEINSRMSALLGFEFFSKLKTVEDRWEIEVKRETRKPIIDSLDKVLADIADALKLRHMLCHEAATFLSVSKDDANRFLNSGSQFTNAISELVSETLHPNAPLTQTDMNIEAGRRASAAEAELDRELGKLREKLDDEGKALLRESQDAWGHVSARICETRKQFGEGRHHAIHAPRKRGGGDDVQSHPGNSRKSPAGRVDRKAQAASASALKR